jgi:hypothetical protein
MGRTRVLYPRRSIRQVRVFQASFRQPHRGTSGSVTLDVFDQMASRVTGELQYVSLYDNQVSPEARPDL